MQISFPEYERQPYYKTHYLFVKSLAEAVKRPVVLRKLPSSLVNAFYMEVGDKPVIVDFSDHLTINQEAKTTRYFKYHYSIPRHKVYPQMFPLTPISFYAWERFRVLRTQIQYQAAGSRILNNQALHSGDIERRRSAVQQVLWSRYGNDLDLEITPQEIFWRKLSGALTSVCVPGSRPNILDRGQFQMMAFGGCTISPKIEVCLPYMKTLVAGEHYVECARDFADVIDKIEWCREHRKECRLIGGNAAALFAKTATAECVWDWLERCIAD